MSKFLIDEDVNQRAIRSVPIDSKGFDVLFPEQGSYKGADDTAVSKIANAEQRVLVSVERDFGKFQLQPEDVPDGAIWLRPGRISQRRISELLTGLCNVLLNEFPSNPYDFRGKIVEVYADRVVIHALGGHSTSYLVARPSNHRQM
jgi:predicted nuclease of predicted toxin-antitoxin system